MDCVKSKVSFLNKESTCKIVQKLHLNSNIRILLNIHTEVDLLEGPLVMRVKKMHALKICSRTCIPLCLYDQQLQGLTPKLMFKPLPSTASADIQLHPIQV